MALGPIECLLEFLDRAVGPPLPGNFPLLELLSKLISPLTVILRMRTVTVALCYGKNISGLGPLASFGQLHKV